jgi:hypothetical protein
VVALRDDLIHPSFVERGSICTRHSEESRDNNSLDRWHDDITVSLGRTLNEGIRNKRGVRESSESRVESLQVPSEGVEKPAEANPRPLSIASWAWALPDYWYWSLTDGRRTGSKQRTYWVIDRWGGSHAAFGGRRVPAAAGSDYDQP